MSLDTGMTWVISDPMRLRVRSSAAAALGGVSPRRPAPAARCGQRFEAGPEEVTSARIALPPKRGDRLSAVALWWAFEAEPHFLTEAVLGMVTRRWLTSLVVGRSLALQRTMHAAAF